MKVRHGAPVVFEGEDYVPVEPIVDCSRLLRTFRAYRDAAHALLNGRFAELKDSAPAHLREPCDISVLKCSDAIVVRYDRVSAEKPMVRGGAVPMNLEQAAPLLTEAYLYFPREPASFRAPAEGPTLSINRHDASGNLNFVASLRVAIIGRLTPPPDGRYPAPPARPCIASVTNEFEFGFHGELLPEGDAAHSKSPGSRPTQFITRSRLVLPGTWRSVEVYPLLGDEYWKPEYGATWAELDIQASLLQRNLLDAQFREIDPRGATRRKYAAILEEFEKLLSGAEEPLHQFLKAHPEILSPTHVRSWSKLPFGEHVSDFVFLDAAGEYELVEIEAPIRALFRQDGHPRQQLNHAIGQTRDWVQYIASNRERVEQRLGLRGISTSPRVLVVIGRDANLTGDLREKLVALQSAMPKLRVLTYDAALALARANFERILGPLSLLGNNVEVYFFE